MSDLDLAPVRTDRLLLRRFRAGDLPALLAYRNDPEVARYQSWALPADEGAARELIAASAEAPLGGPDGLQLAVALAANDELIGDLYLGRWGGDGRQAVIGYTLTPERQGRGYATEAVRALLGLAFDGLGLHRAVATVDPRNMASVSLLERLGMRREGHFLQAYYDDRYGEWTDEYLYAMLRAEWPRG
jgi:aminoglycoside 6'-N-acetyltransferase